MPTLGDSEGSFDYLCEQMGLAVGDGLFTEDYPPEDEHQKYIFDNIRKKIRADAIFFINPPHGGPPTPLIYFHKLEALDNKRIADLHKTAWNMGQAPLLFIVLPGKVLVYSSYAKPKEHSPGCLDDQAGLVEELNLLAEVEAERKKLLAYHRSEIETGRFWHNRSSDFKRETRVFTTLLNNLKHMRQKLCQMELDVQIVHQLLGRVIFIKYLEDRKDDKAYNVFPKNFFQEFLSGANSFPDLLQNKKSTYDLFRYLSERFSGDVFHFEPVEESIVEQTHLNKIRELLLADKYLDSGQMALWRLYSFDVIPIELISNIYEEFFHTEIANNGDSDKGTHYTPYHLVAFLVDETFPLNEDLTDVRVLDPACGSGIFLVEVYRRLIEQWKRSNPDKNLNAPILKNILKDCIFGIDKNPSAVSVTALSLYLSMCDYLEPRYIWKRVDFPELLGKNLFVNDFFSKDSQFTDMKYDIIIGNPPWHSDLTDEAEEYLEETNRPVGDRQIAQVFLWKSADLCKTNGKVCLLVTSKGLLFNRSQPNRAFRRSFFSSYNINTVINFSALRHILFSKSDGPASAVIFSPHLPEGPHSIIYCSPKPSHSLQDDWQFIIEPHDIVNLPQEEVIENDLIWKVAMWGGSRDYDHIKLLSNFPTLKDLCTKKGWIYGDGLTIGNRKNEAAELAEMPFVATRKLERYTMDEGALPSLNETHFYRSKKNKRKIFAGPHLLIKKSPKAGTGLVASLLKNDAVFQDAIIGIHGKKEDIPLLAALCIIINSEVPLYFALLSSSTWMVERDKINVNEIMDIPIPDPIMDAKISFEYLQRLKDNSGSEKLINEFTDKLYSIDDVERTLINDTINYTWDYFRLKRRASAVEIPSDEIVETYTREFCNVLNTSFAISDKVFNGKHSSGKDPLRVVSIHLENLKRPVIKFDSRQDLENVLEKLNESLLEEKSPGVYVRRIIRRYIGTEIYIVKPNEERYWTKSQALHDADETYRDIMELWREESIANR
jgi:type I restriction-modification system DNA methylase subunit